MWTPQHSSLQIPEWGVLSLPWEKAETGVRRPLRETSPFRFTRLVTELHQILMYNQLAITDTPLLRTEEEEGLLKITLFLLKNKN